MNRYNVQHESEKTKKKKTFLETSGTLMDWNGACPYIHVSDSNPLLLLYMIFYAFRELGTRFGLHFLQLIIALTKLLTICKYDVLFDMFFPVKQVSIKKTAESLASQRKKKSYEKEMTYDIA